MNKIYKCIDELIGNTPLLELRNIKKEVNGCAAILAKLEMFNPAGSAKDRIALKMINDAEEDGLLKPGTVIIEPTSGNTGIGLASVASSRGYRAIIVMPDTMSEERRILMKAYGAEVVLTEGAKGMAGAIQKAQELSKEIESSFIPSQFTNPSNPIAHYETTGPELWESTNGKIDILIAGVGTGGTLSGTGKYLKEKNPNIKIIAVEPASSPLLSNGISGAHGLQGIGANFIPDTLDTNIYDEIYTVAEDEAYYAARLLGKKEGILCGISSGAALFTAIEYSKKDENTGKNIVVILPDTGERYLSTDLFK